jgi:hypothetical protein
MATIYITEFKATSGVAHNEVTSHKKAIGAASALSSVFNDSTRRIRICADAACQIALGTAPTADANSMFLPANAPEYLSVPQGKSWRLAVIEQQ